MGSSPSEKLAGRQHGELEEGLWDAPKVPETMRLGYYQVRDPFSLDMLNRLTADAFGASGSALTGQMNQALGGAARAGSARGYSMGLTNPFAFAEANQNQVYQNFAPQFGQLAAQRAGAMRGNPLEVLRAELARKGMNFDAYMRMRQMQMGAGQAVGQEAWTDMLGGLLGGAGQIGGAYI